MYCQISLEYHDTAHTPVSFSIFISKTVQARIGHADIRTTLNTYVHCLPSINKSAGDKLDMLFTNPVTQID